MGPVRLVILQSTPFCNIDCSYCYLPDRKNKARMAPAVVEALGRKLLTENLIDHSVEVCWHAGEPLAVPIDHYERLIESLDRVLAGSVRVEYSIQTNGTLITPEWCRFFAEHAMRVGVSLDGPKHIHDRYRRDRAGQGTFDRVMHGIECLQSSGINPYVIGVLHRESLPKPDELFWFFQSTQVREVCFNVEEIEGANVLSSLGTLECFDEVSRFFRRYFELMDTTPGSHWLREFAHTVRRLCARVIHNAQTNPLEMITVAFDGTYSTLSPELVGVRTSDQGSFKLGNVLSEESIRDCATRATWLRDVADGVDLCKRTCKYYEVCGGGSPSNKIAENGTFVSTETLYCRLGIQAPIEAMLSLLGGKVAMTSLNEKAVAPGGTFGDLRVEAY